MNAYEASGDNPLTEAVESSIFNNHWRLNLDEGSVNNKDRKFHYYANGTYLGQLDKSGGIEFRSNLTGYQVGTGTISYTVTQGDTLRTIAQRVYGNESLWYVIADANGIDLGDALTPGLEVNVPSVDVNKNDFATYEPYDPSKVIGSTVPNLPYIPPPPEAGCSGIGAIIVQAIAMLATAVLTFYGGPVGAMVGNLFSQALFNATGMQEGVDLGQMAQAGITSFIMGGPTPAASTAQAAGQATTQSLGQAALSAASQSAVNYVVNYAVGRALGMDVHFNLREMAFSSIATSLDVLLGGSSVVDTPNGPIRVPNAPVNLPPFNWSQVATHTMNAVARTATRAILHDALDVPGQFSAMSTFADQFGNVLANDYIARNNARGFRPNPPITGLGLGGLVDDWANRALESRPSNAGGGMPSVTINSAGSGQGDVAFGIAAPMGFNDSQAGPGSLAIDGLDLVTSSGQTGEVATIDFTPSAEMEAFAAGLDSIIKPDEPGSGSIVIDTEGVLSMITKGTIGIGPDDVSAIGRSILDAFRDAPADARALISVSGSAREELLALGYIDPVKSGGDDGGAVFTVSEQNWAKVEEWMSAQDMSLKVSTNGIRNSIGQAQEMADSVSRETGSVVLHAYNDSQGVFGLMDIPAIQFRDHQGLQDATDALLAGAIRKGLAYEAMRTENKLATLDVIAHSEGTAVLVNVMERMTREDAATAGRVNAILVAPLIADETRLANLGVNTLQVVTQRADLALFGKRLMDVDPIGAVSAWVKDPYVDFVNGLGVEGYRGTVITDFRHSFDSFVSSDKFREFVRWGQPYINRRR